MARLQFVINPGSLEPDRLGDVLYRHGAQSVTLSSAGLEWLDGTGIAGKTLLDFGCGSGILAIAGLKLGARSATAVDTDLQARTATRQNALSNGIDDRLVTMQVAAVCAAYRHSVEFVATAYRDDWARLSATRI